MKTKKSKGIWIILAVILAVVAFLSFSSCLNARREVKPSEFNAVVNSMFYGNYDAVLDNYEYLETINIPAINDEIKGSAFNMTKGAKLSVLFDGYVVEFDLVSVETGQRLTFTTNYSRSPDVVIVLE